MVFGRTIHLFVLVFGLIFKLSFHAQINAYARVTAISNASVLTLSNVNQTFGSFVVGEKIIVIQMKGATITGNTGDNANFGIPNSLNSAGLYEVAIVQAINGGVTSMTLNGTLSNAYTTGGLLQIVSYPKLGTTFYNTTANINGLAWNGNVGGIIAFYVEGNLNLFHNISANGIGFRGGAKAGQDGGACETNVFRIASGDPKYADKGEGIYATTAAQRSGRAKAVNGGGGGIVHNGGGGGGGNFTAGGDGYYGYTGGGYCSVATNAGGQGGLAVSSNASRVFMGGAGGGGQENNNIGSDGGDGGGIILMRADTIVVSGACSAVSISANGVNAATGNNDGMGGGGAGGSMVVEIKGIRAIGACPLTISANGGNGGDVNNGASHGAGGGGGQGALYISANGPFSNTTLNSNNGNGGASRTGGGAPTGGSGGGSNGSGVITGTNTSPLPIKLVYFSASEISKSQIELQWQTASEKDNVGFEILHTSNGGVWKKIATLEGFGNSDIHHNYSFTHTPVFTEMNYYKLKQIDDDGSIQYSPLAYVRLDQIASNVKLYPNPSLGFVHLETLEEYAVEEFSLYNSAGIQVSISPTKTETTTYFIDLQSLPKGLYILKFGTQHEKIILE